MLPAAAAASSLSRRLPRLSSSASARQQQPRRRALFSSSSSAASFDCDVLVCGAGVVGLAVARAFARYALACGHHPQCGRTLHGLRHRPIDPSCDPLIIICPLSVFVRIYVCTQGGPRGADCGGGGQVRRRSNNIRIHMTCMQN